MRNFIIGIVFTLVLLFLGVFAFTWLGFINTAAEGEPGTFETYFATEALAASIDRHALRSSNPVPETDANLLEGMVAYSMNCATCHGPLNKKESALGSSFYPPAPQLIIDHLDDPEWQTFHVVKHGIRYTGMPAWGKTLDDQTVWKVISFMSRLDNLPPAVKQQMPEPAPK